MDTPLIADALQLLWAQARVCGWLFEQKKAAMYFHDGISPLDEVGGVYACVWGWVLKQKKVVTYVRGGRILGALTRPGQGRRRGA